MICSKCGNSIGDFTTFTWDVRDKTTGKLIRRESETVCSDCVLTSGYNRVRRI